MILSRLLVCWSDRALKLKNMFRMAKTILCLAVLLFGFQKASAFSLLGPLNEGFQQGGSPNDMDYNFGFDIGGPKNIGEEYCWNLPPLYYGFDESFFDYLRPNRVYTGEQEFGVFEAFTKVISLRACL